MHVLSFVMVLLMKQSVLGQVNLQWLVPPILILATRKLGISAIRIRKMDVQKDCIVFYHHADILREHRRHFTAVALHKPILCPA